MKSRSLHLSVSFALIVFITYSLQAQSSLEAISVKGNIFVSESGKKMIFQGVNIRDPHQLKEDGVWTKAHFEKAKDWGSDLVRLPVHPGAWNNRGEQAYLELLDEAVTWAGELGMYLIIDWHSIGNLSEAKFQNPMYNTTFEETKEFWNTISKHFKDEPIVAMYELYNEPTVSGKNFGNMSWKTWKKMNVEMIELIRKNDPKTVILVAGFNWAYDLTPIKDDAIDMENIAYVSHPYPEKRDQPWEEKWEEDWGFVAKKHPVILTEIGFALPDERGAHVPVKGDETYGNALVDFCNARGVSWVVWCFDNRWSPFMYTGDYEPTRQGAFFRDVMRRQ
ncbi:glycoside hydrolase family 5 protein [Bacteroidota bacterium]